MKQCQTSQAPLRLKDIWNNIFLKLCDLIVGNGNQTDYFIVEEDENSFKILRVSNQEERWQCMMEPGVAWHYPSATKDKDNPKRYTREFNRYICDLLDGSIEEHKKQGNSFRNTNKRYEELLSYLVEKGAGTITKEILFIQDTVMNSCMLKLYMEEKTRGGRVIDETKVLKSQLAQYKDQVRIDYVEDSIRQYLSAYYTGLESRNALEALAVVILRTLCQVSVRESASGGRLKNEENIRTLQEQFISQIEDYLREHAGGQPPVINVSLIRDWETKWFSLREQLVGYSVSEDFLKALDNTYRLRVLDISRASFGPVFKDHLDIQSVLADMREEMQNIDLLLKYLDTAKEALSGLQERNKYVTQNEVAEVVQEAVSLQLKLNN